MKTAALWNNGRNNDIFVLRMGQEDFLSLMTITPVTRFLYTLTFFTESKTCKCYIYWLTQNIKKAQNKKDRETKQKKYKKEV